MKLNQAYQRYPLIVLIGVFIVADICAFVFHGDSIAEDVMSTSIAAVIMTIALGIFVPFTFGRPTGEERRISRHDTSLIGSLVLVALVGGICSVVLPMLGDFSISTDAAVSTTEAVTESASGDVEMVDLDASVRFERGVLVVLLCVVTGIYEEGLFRGLLVPCVTVRAEKDNVGVPPQFFAAVFSALIFGLVHLSGIVDAATGAEGFFALIIVIAQAVVKVIQAGLFGFCLATMFVRTQSVWLPMITHMIFDFLYLGPTMLMTGELVPTYFTGNWLDLAILVLTVILLLPPSARSLQWLRQNTSIDTSTSANANTDTHMQS